MHKKITLACLLAAATALPVSGFAAKDLNYSYAELGYYNVDGDASEGDGFRAFLSGGVHDNVQLRATFINADIDTVQGVTTDIRVDEFQVGIAGRYSFVKGVDATAGIDYVVQNYSRALKDDTEGHVADLGIRVKMFKKFEMNAGFITQVLHEDSSNGFYLGAVADLTKKFSVSFRAEDSDDADERNYFLGLRLNF